jgi:pimeloyl-ACP methyl ester carboxylesterase
MTSTVRRLLPWAAVPASMAVGAAATAAVGAAAVGAVSVAARRRRRWTDPAGPRKLALPGGVGDVVRTDDGAELALHLAGPADGPLVVLVHCWTGNKELWAPVGRRLVQLGHRVVLYDQRGHGSSSFGAGLDCVDRLGDDLAAVLSHLDARDVVVAGHSMGGMSIQAYVGGHRADAGERLAGAVLVATAARTLGRALPAVLAERTLGDLGFGWVRTGRPGALVARGSLGRRAVRDHAHVVRDALAATPGDVRVRCLLAMAEMDLRPGLGGLDIPATILVGTRDLLTPVRSARSLERAWPQAALRVLPGAGHMLPLERPDDIVEAVLRATATQPERGVLRT